MFIIIPLAAWLFLDETLKKSPTDKKDNSETDSMATECENDTVVTIETDLTSDTMVTSDTTVTANSKVIEDNISITRSINDDEPLLESHGPVVKINWKAKFWQLFYDRVYCCHGCNLSRISCRLSRKDFNSASAKIVTMAKLMMDRRVIVSVSLYGLLGFVAIITNEVIYSVYILADHMIL